ncbi:MAG: hypothetical protein ACLGIZ_15225 [Acidimicrobiia bacterium]
MSDVLEFSPEELLASHDIEEPLVLGGVRCHGGFLADGTYVSPRTKHRAPALAAWQEQHRAAFGTEILHAPVETWPANYPNVEQARFLLRSGAPEPIIATLTRIGTVEGFGSLIRFLAPTDMQRHFDDDIRGTATAHLSQGLVEAHARDEAGWSDEAGHDRMWYAVRDIAFENPVTEDETAEMMKRMGIPVGVGADPDAARSRFLDRRAFPDLDLGLELLVSTMLRVLFVEIKAFHVFAWAEELLADRDLVAGDGEAARLVSFIRADETPHVEYLRTSLTEMRDRTFIGESGRRYPGTDVIGRMWDASMAESLGLLEDQNRKAVIAEIERALLARPDGADLLAEFHRLGDPAPAGR